MSPDKNLQINIDGGSRGNPGPAAYAFVVSQNNTTIYQESNFIGLTTNNIAEYTGLINALKYLQTLKPTQINIHMDSLLVVQQINGKYKVKQPHLQKLHSVATDLINNLKKSKFEILITHVYREANISPDLLLNQCLDQHGK